MGQGGPVDLGRDAPRVRPRLRLGRSMLREQGTAANAVRFFSQARTASDATRRRQVNCLSSGGHPQSRVRGWRSSGTSGGGRGGASRSPSWTTATTETTSRSALSSTAACPAPTRFRLPRMRTGRGRAEPARMSPRGSAGRSRSASPATVRATGRVRAIPQSHLQARQSRNYRGVGIDHQHGCSECCASCDGGELNYRLTCN